MPIRFLDIYDDILLKIAYECTAAEVVALERTCKTLQSFFSHPNRQLWLHLLRDLDDFHAPDLPPYTSVDSLSFADLKRLVTHAIDGYANWNTSSPSGPKITRRRIIDLKNKGGLLGDLIRYGRETVKILPGGKYLFLLWSEGYLQCRDIEKNEVIWTYPQLGTFQSIRVIAFDAQHDVRNGLLFVALMEDGVERIEECVMKSLWINPETKQVALTRQAQQGFAYFDIPTVFKICRDAIIILNQMYCTIVNKNLHKWIRLIRRDILDKTVRTVDGYLVFMAKPPSYYADCEVFSVDTQRIFIDPRMQDLIERGIPSNALSLYSDALRHVVLRAPLPGSDHLSESEKRIIAAQLMTCRPTWREPTSGSDASTTIYVVAKFRSSSIGNIHPPSTEYHLFSFRLSATSPAIPPSLTLVHAWPPVSIPLSHPYCTEEVHSLSHAGRGLLASTNLMHKAVRYYTFSLEELFNGRVRESFGPISFGKERTAPGEVYMEQYSGALAYVTKDGTSLVIQYYD